MHSMEQDYHEGCGEMGEAMMMWMKCMPKDMKKQLKMAMLRKKERMLEAKLAFVREMKDMMEKMSMEMEEEKEKK